MTETEAERYWEKIYRAASPETRGRPGRALEQFATPLPPGDALELGCAKGDDTIWLAGKGWRVTSVDISPTAIRYASANAARAGVADRIVFERHDLSQTFPKGRFDMVLASFLHSPVDFPRSDVLRRAAEAVSLNGHLLIVEHASRAPWSWAPPDMTYPAAEETLSSLSLSDASWSRLHVAAIERHAQGPEGQTAAVLDNVIFLKRIG